MTKLRKFAREYAKCFNSTSAAISAGASEKSAHVLGCRWLKKVKDSGLLLEESERELERAGVEKGQVLSEIAKLAFANMGDYLKLNEDGELDVNLKDLPREKLAAIQEITVDATGGSGDGERRKIVRTRFKLASKKDNLELLAKNLQLLTEKKQVEVVGKDGGPIQTAIQVSFVDSNAAAS